MNRRHFLIGIAKVTLSGIAVAALPGSMMVAVRAADPEATALGKLFKGTRDGRVFESLDGGQTWQPRANFGKHCAILALAEHQGQLWAQVGLQGHSFYLTSSDARTWRTVPQI